jgi:hypothetical protein
MDSIIARLRQRNRFDAKLPFQRKAIPDEFQAYPGTGNHSG